MRSSEIKLLFAGDFAPVGRYEDIVLECGNQILGDTLEYVKNADLSFINLECPLTFSDDAVRKDGPNLKANPEAIESLKDFSVIGLANNHIMDFGLAGLRDTIAAIDHAGLKSVGADENIHDASEPYVSEIRGKKIALIAIADRELNQATFGTPGVAPIDPVENYSQVIEAKKCSDIVIVTIHGGNEYFAYPRPKFRKFCHFLIDLGVSAVICHHPHVPGAYEYYKGKPIFFSLGNALFDHSKPPVGWQEAYFVQIVFDSGTLCIKDVEIIPFSQSVTQRGLRLLKGSKAADLVKKVDRYRAILADEDAWETEWRHYLSHHSSDYVTKQYSPFLFRGVFQLSKAIGLEKLLLRSVNVPKKLNMLQCDAHRDALEDILIERLRNSRL